MSLHNAKTELESNNPQIGFLDFFNRDERCRIICYNFPYNFIRKCEWG